MEPLPLHKKIFYGMGGLSMALPDMVLMQWLLMRYTADSGSGPLVPAAMMGVIFFLERCTEGISNPFLAYWSDTCRHRWGRRQPFMRLGILPYLALYVLLFHPVSDTHVWLNVLYLLIVTQFYALFFAGIFTPYLALLPELTPNLKERVDLTTFQALFLLIAQLIFVGMGAALDAFGWSVAILGVAGMVGLFLFPSLTLREPPTPEEARPKEPVFKAILSSLENKPFLYVAFSTGLFFFMLNGMIALLPFWVTKYLGLSETHVSYAMAPFLVVTVAFFPVFNALTKWFSKYVLLQATFIATAIIIGAFLFVGVIPGNPFYQTVAVIASVGIPAAGFMVLPYPVLSDVIDYDERRTGKRREGLFFGVQGVIQKILLGCSMLSFTLAPYVTGQPMEAGITLKFMAGLCGAACLLAFFVFLGYPLRERDGKVVDLSGETP